MQNLQKSTLPILFGAVEPAEIISKNANGDTTIGGYVGHLFHSFAKKHNALLNTSNVDVSLSYYDITQLVLSGKVEISASCWIFLKDSMDWYSYPHSFIDFGVMLPIEKIVPVYKMFAFVFNLKAFGLTIVVLVLLSVLLEAAAKLSKPHRGGYYIDCFRGILGQSFSELKNSSFTTKLIYSLIFLLGIMIVTSYDAFLQSFMTEPPREQMIRSFEDLNSYGLKIVAYQPDIDETLLKLRPDLMKKYSHSFQDTNQANQPTNQPTITGYGCECEEGNKLRLHFNEIEDKGNSNTIELTDKLRWTVGCWRNCRNE
ncbi:uncharacterized protein LOC129918168 [Episyrphus balteatus]|uniref:uncharacterized protein LOC129918168 n=1 Tax=Episyrphus balteatus TaxID=286459 RepID=UPI002485E220|nr:uncharacterized protein LOC129918168 [Episyrphus balteatus]